MGSRDTISKERLAAYRYLRNKKEIIKAIYHDIESSQGPSYKVNFVDDKGNIVYGAEGMLNAKGEVVKGKINNKPAKIPAGFYPKVADIIQAGRKQFGSKLPREVWLGRFFPPTLPMTLETEGYAEYLRLPDMKKFGFNGPWDVQRLYVTRGIDTALRDISTINIGIYAAASGMSLDEMLMIEMTYAIYSSNFKWEKETRDIPYFALPQRNVENTRIGYDLYKKGLITGR